MAKFDKIGITLKKSGEDNALTKAPGPQKKDTSVADPKPARKKKGQGRAVTKKKDLGRPKVKEELKLSKKMTLNLTEAEDAIIKDKCKNEFPLPLSASNYIRYKLQEAGVLLKDN